MLCQLMTTTIYHYQGAGGATYLTQSVLTTPPRCLWSEARSHGAHL